MTTPEDNTETAHNAVATIPPDRFEGAFALILASAMALDESSLEVFNADVPHVVHTVLKHLPMIVSLRPQLVRLFDFDVTNVDALEDRALALSHSNTLHTTTAVPLKDSSKEVAEAITLRNVLRRDAGMQLDREIYTPAEMKDIEGLTSFQGIASDLTKLRALHIAHRDELVGLCGVSPAEFARASELAELLLGASTAKEQPRTTAAIELVSRRQRVFTVLSRGYNEVRRAVSYLRWNHGDADDFAPPLYAGKGKSPAKSDATEPTTPASAPSEPAKPAAQPEPAPQTAAPADAVTKR